ncbi:hypothetical protein J5X84_06910 [Streptosporangiaceae bacterium NEAU-GS5]|nr:hypothetical protein [Streptosporangiaceae bacterium NEAU-GS5]
MIAGTVLLATSALVPIGPSAQAGAAAAPSSAASVTAKAREPFSVFAVSVKGPKKVKAGTKYTYLINATNKGPYSADWDLGGFLPDGIVTTLTWRGPKNTQCVWYRFAGFWCWGPYEVPVGESTWLAITVTLKKGTKGTLKAKLGGETCDCPTGSEGLSRQEWKRLGIKNYFWAKTVKTTIISKKAARHIYVPPPPKPPPHEPVHHNRRKST